jgi:hypothetical protein
LRSITHLSKQKFPGAQKVTIIEGRILTNICFRKRGSEKGNLADLKTFLRRKMVRAFSALEKFWRYLFKSYSCFFPFLKEFFQQKIMHLVFEMLNSLFKCFVESSSEIFLAPLLFSFI